MKEKPEWKKLIDCIHEKHINYIRKDSPDGLAFHYTSPIGLLGVISTQSIWLSNSDYLNDVSESDYFFGLCSDIVKPAHGKKAENLAFRTYLISMFHSKTTDRGRETFSREKERRYVFSLSLDSDSLSLWSYYTKTKDSTGYNVGFDLEKLTNSLELYSNQELLIGRVIYNYETQKDILRELYNDYLDVYERYTYSYQRQYLYDSLEDNIAKYSVFMKDSAFLCENEFRIAIFEKGLSQDKKQYREKDGAFVPYIIKKIDVDSVTSIMISSTTRTDFVKSSVVDLCDNYGVNHANVEKSKIPIRY